MPRQETSRPKSLYWCFTINNPSELPDAYDAPQKLTSYLYLVYQVEVGDSGTEHLQGYVVFNTRTRLSELKKVLPTAHWEMRRGTHEQAKAYCTKEDSRVMGPYEFGDDSQVPRTVGQRTDLLKVKELLDQNVPESKIQDDYFGSWVRYHKSFELYRSQRGKARDTPPKVEIYYGVPGSGKSYLARKELPNAFYLSRPGKNAPVWWDGYSTGQDVVIDEFYGWIPYMDILRILDRYAWKAQIKGGFVNFDAPRIIITSNMPPSKWYTKVEDKSAFHRRLKEFCQIYRFDTPYEYDPAQDPVRVPMTWDEVVQQSPVPTITPTAISDLAGTEEETSHLNFGLPTGPRFNF